MPAGIVMIGGTREGTAAEDEQVPAAIEKVMNGRPIRFRKSGTIGQDKQASVRIREQGNKLFRRSEASTRERLLQLLLRENRRVGSGKRSFPKHDYGRSFLRPSGRRVGEEG